MRFYRVDILGMMDKKSIPLITALAIPFLMIVLIAALIYLPGLNKKPQYNFVYASGDESYSYGYNWRAYTVEGGRLTKQPLPQPNQSMPVPDPKYPVPQPIEPKLYFYDVQKNQAREISFEQAQSLNLDPANVSPDGYEVVQGNGNGGGGFIFGGSGDYQHYFLRGHNRSKQLNLKQVGSYYNFRFLGWVK